MRDARQLTRAAAVFAALGLCAALVAPARAALFGDDEARKAILELRDRVTALEGKQQQTAAELARRTEQLDAVNRAQLDFADTTDKLRQEIAALRGQVEQLGNELATQQKRSRDLYGDLDARLKKFEPVTVTLDGRQVTVDRNEQAAYDAALTRFRASDFQGAAAGLQGFVGRFPQSAYAASAQYWLGNSLYAQKDYAGAIAAQNVVVTRFRDSPRAPDALLNIASSQVELKQTQQAADTLKRILNEFPDSDAARTARDRLAAMPPTPPPPAKKKR